MRTKLTSIFRCRMKGTKQQKPELHIQKVPFLFTLFPKLTFYLRIKIHSSSVAKTKKLAEHLWVKSLLEIFVGIAVFLRENKEFPCILFSAIEFCAGLFAIDCGVPFLNSMLLSSRFLVRFHILVCSMYTKYCFICIIYFHIFHYYLQCYWFFFVWFSTFFLSFKLKIDLHSSSCTVRLLITLLFTFVCPISFKFLCNIYFCPIFFCHSIDFLWYLCLSFFKCFDIVIYSEENMWNSWE